MTQELIVGALLISLVGTMWLLAMAIADDAHRIKTKDHHHADSNTEATETIHGQPSFHKKTAA